MTRNTHDRRYDHHSVDLATNVVLETATSSYVAGSTVEAVVDDLDDRVAAVSSAAATADPSPFELVSTKWQFKNGIWKVWSSTGDAYINLEEDYAELGTNVSTSYLGIADNLVAVIPGRVDFSDVPGGLFLPAQSAEPPTPPVEGVLYYDTDTKQLRIYSGSAWKDLGPQNASVSFVIDGGGSPISTGVKGDIEIPFAGTITAARLLADQTGSIVVDILKATYANWPTVSSITASAKPTLSSAQKSENTTLTGWTKTIAAGDILRFNVDSASTLTRVTLALTITRS